MSPEILRSLSAPSQPYVSLISLKRKLGIQFPKYQHPLAYYSALYYRQKHEKELMLADRTACSLTTIISKFSIFLTRSATGSRVGQLSLVQGRLKCQQHNHNWNRPNIFLRLPLVNSHWVRTLPVVQWLRRHIPNVGGTGSIPGWGTKTPDARVA